MRSFRLLATGIALAAACGSPERRGPADHVARLDDRHTLFAPVVEGNLTVWPVLTDRPIEVGEFLTLEEALAKGAAEVREVGGEAAAAEEPAESRQEAEQLVQVADGAAIVGTLVIENRGDLPILVCAGTVVKGGKQDRQIGQDVVLKARSTTPVDAFCVEQGRWQQVRAGQNTGGRFEVLEGMATAKVRAKGQYEKDQGAVWQEVAEAKESAVVHAPNNQGATLLADTSSFAVAVDVTATSEEIERCRRAILAHFRGLEGAVGFAYAINGRPVAVRTFAHPRLLERNLDSFALGMATEALLGRDASPPPEARAEDLVAMVRSIASADERIEETRALNRNGVRTSAVGYGAACYVPGREGEPVRLTQDYTAK